MTRAVLALIALFALTAFAPAPFSKARREDNKTTISMQLLQGHWKVVSHEVFESEGQKRKTTFVESVRFKDDQWTLLNFGSNVNARYTFVLDGSTRPATIDFYYGVRDKNSPTPPSFFGLIHRQGDTLRILYYEPRERLSHFANAPVGAWLLTLRRIP
jgi:uncharacterized protein (TIGR03067 family)